MITKHMDLTFKKQSHLLFDDAGDSPKNTVEVMLFQYPCLGLETQVSLLIAFS